MILQYVTVSGPNEFTDIKGLAELMTEFKLGEIGIQVSDKQSPAGGARIEWIHELVSYLRASNTPMNAALHVNLGWVEALCHGRVDDTLKELLELTDMYRQPFFKRVQLNFKIGRDNVQEDEANVMLPLIQHILKRHFILSHNESNRCLIAKLYLQDLKFDCLFDASFGQGVLPEERPWPAFNDLLQGYAGGLTPDNVSSELDKIAKAATIGSHVGRVYIDAQKGLEDENGHLSLDKAHDYLENATAWYRNYLMPKQ